MIPFNASFPRGIRNNNPLNILCSTTNNFEGDISKAGDAYCTFTSPIYGIRAGLIVLRNYVVRDGVKTVSAMISRWAPPTENPTDTYIVYVARRMGVGPTYKPRPYLGLVNMVGAMTEFENGWNPYSTRLILEVAQCLEHPPIVAS